MNYISLLRRVASAGALLVGLGAAQEAKAATFTVTSTSDSGAGSLRQAVLDANSASGDDSISFDSQTFASAQTIALTSGPIEVANNGKLDIVVAYPYVTLQGRSSNSSPGNRILKISAGADVSLSGVIFSSASASNSNGGAINNDGILTLTRCYFGNNTAYAGLGGAIFNATGSTLTANNCQFDRNSALGGEGGAIVNSGTATVNATSFTNNDALVGSGGAISNKSGTFTLSNCSFDLSTAQTGGAISNTGGTLTIEGSTFTNNVANNGVGGAISNSSSLTARNCTFYGNRADTSEGFGGAIYISAGTCVLGNNTLSRNYGERGGGIFNDSATLSVNNTIIADNQANTGPNILGTVTTGDYNLVDNVAGATLSGTHNITGKPANLRQPSNYGGPTKVCVLEPGSPAIDAGNSTLTTDQRGETRPVDVVSIPNAPGGNGSDIGAVEMADTPQFFSFIVSATDDHDDGTCGVYDCTLREAINGANESPNTSAIGFNSSVFAGKRTIDITAPLPPVTTNVNILGPTANGAGVTLRDTSSGQNSTLSVKNAAMVTVAYLTFTDAPGSAISVAGGRVAVRNCTFSNCNYGLQNGSGPTSFNEITVDNSTFVGSTGAAILNGGNNATSSTATLLACTFTGNSYGIDVQSGTVNLSNSLVVGNNTANIRTAGGTLSGDHNITSGTATAAGLDPAGLKDNGGPTPTIALVQGGSAVDAGNLTSYTDQRGRIRPFDFAAVPNANGGSGSDIGAYELQETPQSSPNFVVNRTDDHDDSVCGPTDCTLRESINAANADTKAFNINITFDATVFASKTTIALANGLNLPSINRNLTLQGPSAPGAGVTIRNSQSGNGYCLYTRLGTILISNLTLSGGQVGLYSDVADVTVTGCTITQTGSSGIFNSAKTLTVDNSTIAFNSGDGIRSTLSADLKITSCSVVANGQNGLNVTEAGRVNLSNSLVVGNGTNLSPTNISENNNSITSGTISEAGLDAGGLKDNGGPTPTIALVAGSPAINAGATSLATDQRGVTRDSKPDIGAYELANTAPGFASITPQDVTDKVGIKRTFNLTVVDAEGARDISEVWLLINERLSWNAGATLIYVPSATSPTSGLLYLRKGDAFLAPIQVGEGASSSAVLDNGVVRVVANEVLVTASGNVVRMSLPLTIRDGLVGNNRIFGRVVDRAGATDPASLAGDDGYIRFGTYTVTPQFSGGANSAPVLSRLTPGAINTALNSSGVAPVQTFSFAVKDDNGSGDLESVWFLAGKQRNWTNSATFIYQPRSRRLYLRSDDGNSFLGGGVIGTSGILENSQVRVDLSKVKTTIYPDGKTIGLSLPLQAKTGLVGQNKVWLRAQDNQGATAPNGDAQGYVLSGTWNVTGATAPNSANELSAGGS